MNRNQAKEILPIIQAFIDGKQIQHLYNKWEDIENLTNDLIINPELYRIKPGTKYRPFKDAEECWNEMQKHQPFGWIKSKDDSTINKFMFIDSLQNNAANICTSCDFSYNKLAECYIFADGTTFGIKEE